MSFLTGTGRLLMVAGFAYCLSSPAWSGSLAVRHHVVAVGVRYPGDTLRFTMNDAKLFSRIFKDRAVTNILLTSDGPKLPTKANILSSVDRALDAAGPADIVWVTFSGHGAQHQGRTLLVPHDNRSTVDSWIDLAMLRRGMRARTKARLLVFVVDVCHAAGVKSVAASNAETMLSGLSGTAIFASSLPHQVSREFAALRHGLFMYYFSRGLAGEASSGGSITLKGLYQYVSARMSRWQNGDPRSEDGQTPFFVLEGDPVDGGGGGGQTPAEPVIEPNPAVLDSLPPEPAPGSGVVAMEPLKPSVIVDVSISGPGSELVGRLAGSRVREALIGAKFPVVSSELAAGFLDSYRQAGSQAGQLAYERFGASFLLRLSATVSTRTNTIGSERTHLAEISLSGQVLSAKGSVLVEADSDSDSGLAQQGVGFTEERAIRVALNKALDRFLKQAMTGMESEIRPRLGEPGGLESVLERLEFVRLWSAPRN